MTTLRLLICGTLAVCAVMWYSRSLDETVAVGSDYVTSEYETLATSEKTSETQSEKPLPFDTCILPEYDPWDEGIIPYVEQDYNPLKDCNRSFKPLTTLHDGIVTINKKNISCWGRCLTRRSETSNKRGRWVNVDEANFRCDIIETKCKDARDKDIYQMVHAQIIEKNNSKAYSNEDKDGNLYSVYVILLDSHSSTQGTRNLPQTMHFLEKSLQAVSFPHINKVGLNSRPNGVAMWFGKRLESVDRKLFGLPDVEPDWTYNSFCHRYVDNETFIFKEFSARGYKTMLAEDWMQGTLNWPDCWGFKNQPTDHYMRPFQVALEKKVAALLKKTYSTSNCIEQHQDVLRYLQDFINSYDGFPKFGWIWLSLLGHDHESGSIHADPDFQRFLLRNKKKLDNSFLIILGDHGLRGGKVTHTELGSFEVNNPMFSISIPKKLRRSTTILATLRENAKSLQTMFDIRATLLDILKYQPETNFTDREYMPFQGEYGSSLLRHQQATERSCKSLLIPLAYCTCQYPMKEIKRTADIASAAGSFLIQHINTVLKENKVTHICDTLRFKHTISISAYVPENATKTYQVSVKAHPPSGGEFKAIVRQAQGKFEMASSSIDRLDRFGKKGNCVKDSLKRLCHCKVKENNKRSKKLRKHSST